MRRPSVSSTLLVRVRGHGTRDETNVLVNTGDGVLDTNGLVELNGEDDGVTWGESDGPGLRAQLLTNGLKNS